MLQPELASLNLGCTGYLGMCFVLPNASWRSGDGTFPFVSSGLSVLGSIMIFC